MWNALSRVALPLTVVFLAWTPASLFAEGCATCQPAAAAPATCAPATCAPQVQYVEKTVLCPQWVTEKRTCTVTACRPEIRQCTVTVCKRIPETKAVQRTCCVMVPETRSRTEQCMVSKPVFHEETRQYTLMVPTYQTCQGTRCVCKWVPEKQKQIVCEDQGHWEQRPCNCGGCSNPCAPACTQTQRCWVPNIVQKEVEVTCMKPVTVEEPYTYQIRVCKPVQKTCTVRVCQYEQAPATRQVYYTECVCKQVTKTEYVTTWRCEEVQETRSYTVMVPYQVQKEVAVPVCQMVPKTIRVPVCPTTCCCEVACCRARHRRCR